MLQHGLKIAIGGKGGVGKTTVSAVLAQLFAEDGHEVIAVDADPDTNLCGAFGLSFLESPEPLINMKELIAERTGTDKGNIGAYFRLNPSVGDLPEKYSLKLDIDGGKIDNKQLSFTLKLLVLGAITRGGGGCACPEGAFLKAMLTHTVLRLQEVVLVDLAAGLELMGRASVQGIDALVVVVEPGGRSIETALNMSNMARQLGVKQAAVIINKVRDRRQVDEIKSKLGDLPVIGVLDYDEDIQRADMERASVFQASSRVVEQIRDAKKVLDELCDKNLES